MKIKINKLEILENFTFDKKGDSKEIMISHKSSKDTKHLDKLKDDMDKATGNSKVKIALEYQKAVSAYNKSK